MKKQKIDRELYTLTHADVLTILGLTAGQKITDITATHTQAANWTLLVNVETTQTTELPTPTHKHEK